MTPEKHQVEVLYRSKRPANAYMLGLLEMHVKALNPKRALDAGCGEMRNLWMFGGEYVGIGTGRGAYYRGLKANRDSKIPMSVYLLRLENDFSFLGVFDMCVCTNTLHDVGDSVDIVRRLVDRIEIGGSLIINDRLERLDAHRRVLDSQFTFSDITFFSTPEREQWIGNGPEFERRFREEMAAPNVPEGHDKFYILASDKTTPPGPVGPPPEMIAENGMYIVKRDMAKLNLDGPPPL